MENKYFSLDERPEKGFVSVLMVIFGILCLGTSGWWAYYLSISAEKQNTYWLATIFLLVFGAYQIYAGLGYARRFIKIEGSKLSIRQNSFTRPKLIEAGLLSSIVIRSADIVFNYNHDKSFKLRLGIRYPDLGEKLKSEIEAYATTNKIELNYKYDIAD